MRSCARCRREAEPIDLFCGYCGERLDSPALPSEVERTHTSLSAAEVNRRLGLVYLARGKRDEALRAFRKAVALNPRDRSLADELRELESGSPGTPGGAAAESERAGASGGGPVPIPVPDHTDAGLA